MRKAPDLCFRTLEGGEELLKLPHHRVVVPSIVGREAENLFLDLEILKALGNLCSKVGTCMRFGGPVSKQ